MTTSMQILRDDEVLYDRDQAFGGAQLTQLIARQYGFSLEEAESKKRSGELPEDYASAVLKPFVQSMTQEVSRALQFFFTSTPHNRIDHIDRKSTRLNSSHLVISYAVFCLKKKKKPHYPHQPQ